MGNGLSDLQAQEAAMRNALTEDALTRGSWISGVKWGGEKAIAQTEERLLTERKRVALLEFQIQEQEARAAVVDMLSEQGQILIDQIRVLRDELLVARNNEASALEAMQSAEARFRSQMTMQTEFYERTLQSRLDDLQYAQSELHRMRSQSTPASREAEATLQARVSDLEQTITGLTNERSAQERKYQAILGETNEKLAQQQTELTRMREAWPEYEAARAEVARLNGIISDLQKEDEWSTEFRARMSALSGTPSSSSLRPNPQVAEELARAQARIQELEREQPALREAADAAAKRVEEVEEQLKAQDAVDKLKDRGTKLRMEETEKV